MSLDFQLAWPCPHTTVGEVVALGEDRRTLTLAQPTSSPHTVQLIANGDVVIPRGGLLSAAVLTSSVSGPFDLTPGTARLQIVTSGGAGALDLQVSSRTRLTADQVVKRIQRQGWSFVRVEAEDGRLVLADATRLGPRAFVKVSGEACVPLGFGSPGQSDLPWSVYGREVYPGWEVVQLPNRINYLSPRFLRPLKTNPVLSVTYHTARQNCLRCQATGYENDFRYDSAGDMFLIQDENLLYQAALKILLTDRGSNPFFPQYGTSLRSRIGTKALSGVSSLISDDIRRALTSLQSQQNQQAKFQTVSFRERLYAVRQVSVQPHPSDPTVFMVDVTVQNASGDPVSLSVRYFTPQSATGVGVGVSRSS